MKILTLFSIILLATIQTTFCQTAVDNKKEINNLINKYIKSVIDRDSVAFYNLFNDGVVTWCAALKDRSQAKEIEKKGEAKAGSNYFSGTYKGFFRSLFKFKTTEDKFDNIKIIEDGTVASVTMDYSFWGNDKMTNWGNKYLALIKRDGQWKITGVIFSLELTEYFEQPSLTERQAKEN